MERLILEGVGRELFPSATGPALIQERRKKETPEITPYQQELLDC
jgi:hypothetical protein